MKEFTVVLFAGGSNRLSNDLSTPKALLPVGNRPLIWYSIQIILSNPCLSSSDLIILCPNSVGDCLNEYLSTLNINYQIVKYREEDKTNQSQTKKKEKENRSNNLVGTLDGLRHCYSMIRTKSICLLTCDLVGKIDLTSMINRFRIENALLMMILTENIDQTSATNKDQLVQPGQKSKVHQEHDLFTLDHKTNRIISVDFKADLHEDLTMRRTILTKFSQSQIRCDLVDCHFYLVDKSLLDIGINLKDSSFRKEFLPKIIREISTGKTVQQIQTLNFRHGNKTIEEIKQNQIDEDHFNELNQSSNQFCFYHLAENSLFRVQHPLSYLEANRQSASLIYFYTNEDVYYKDRSEPIQVSSDCLIDEGLDIGKKTTIKRTVMGKFCRIEDKCKINNCILLDHVHVKEGSILQNSIICSRSTIGNKSEIFNSIISKNQSIENSKKLNGETISSNRIENDLLQLDED